MGFKNFRTSNADVLHRQAALPCWVAALGPKGAFYLLEGLQSGLIMKAWRGVVRGPLGILSGVTASTAHPASRLHQLRLPFQDRRQSLPPQQPKQTKTLLKPRLPEPFEAQARASHSEIQRGGTWVSSHEPQSVFSGNYHVYTPSIPAGRHNYTHQSPLEALAHIIDSLANLTSKLQKIRIIPKPAPRPWEPPRTASGVAMGGTSIGIIEKGRGDKSYMWMSDLERTLPLPS